MRTVEPSILPSSATPLANCWVSRGDGATMAIGAGEVVDGRGAGLLADAIPAHQVTSEEVV